MALLLAALIATILQKHKRLQLLTTTKLPQPPILPPSITLDAKSARNSEKLISDKDKKHQGQLPMTKQPLFKKMQANKKDTLAERKWQILSHKNSRGCQGLDNINLISKIRALLLDAQQLKQKDILLWMIQKRSKSLILVLDFMIQALKELNIEHLHQIFLLNQLEDLSMKTKRLQVLLSIIMRR